MIKLAYLGVAVGVVAYVIGLISMDELASVVGDGSMLTAAVIMLFRVDRRLAAFAGDAGGS